MSRSAFQFCLKCRDLTNLDPIQCDGVCGRVCHRRCTGLSEQQLNIIQTIPNIGWRCDSCLEQAKNNQQLFHKLELSVRQHEKRLEILEAGLVRHDKVNESCKEPVLCPFLPHSISRKAIIITAIFVVLTIILGVILGTTTNLFGKTLNKSKLGDGDDSRLNIPINSTIVIDGSQLVLVGIDEWGGKMSREPLMPQKLPVDRVIIAHTATEGCDNLDVCSYWMRSIQSYHMDTLDWSQIGYNFLVGGDGRVYVGRDWDDIGAHTIRYNTGSIGIAFIGSFGKMEPTELQLRACQLLIAEGVHLGKLSEDYKIYGHKQLLATESPGDKLFKIITTWPHFAKQH
ncbi:peptidoglycan-recognition protein LC isoform X9 [Drosophila grimshawi]|uniref:peptidoglycan-recognition protein LC isoform X9 n=1 Tax=Drosophila grimshawi TaxID=7222 RepID=UPI0013EF2289|nr:peptidoglycan-recognition protein LC isoform X9 [Drosophila grimshawi]